jgi:ElaB/YqjD/DUF883 family membrane-anchored ribosome-binding protein
MTKSNEHQTKDHAEAGDHFSSDLETLQKSFTQLRKDVTHLLDNAVGTAKSGVGAIRSRATHAVDDLKDRGNDSFEQLTDKISERPILSTAIAFGIGFIVAKWNSRGHRG